jgi:hypothetical protein
MTTDPGSYDAPRRQLGLFFVFLSVVACAPFSPMLHGRLRTEQASPGVRPHAKLVAGTRGAAPDLTE